MYEDSNYHHNDYHRDAASEEPEPEKGEPERGPEEVKKGVFRPFGGAFARSRLISDLDVRGLLAVFCIIGAFSLSFYSFYLKGNAEIPTWVTTMVGSVVGFYFGSRGGNGKH